VPPTEPILATRDRVDSEGNVTRTLQPYRWGLVPYWAKDPAAVNTFNTRAESVATKPIYRSAFERKRVLVPADEWKKVANAKQPYAFRRTDGQPMVFAGLCDHWKTPGGHWLASATIITTLDNPDMHEIHDRMPVILESRAMFGTAG
jgi:putative SOS response-associated peptidase YedK